MTHGLKIRVERPGESQCPLCWEGIVRGGPEPLHTCRSCATDYHQACVVEMHGCSTLGCARKGWRPASIDPDLHRYLTPQRRMALTFQARRVKAFSEALRDARLTGDVMDHDHRDVYGGLALIGGLLLTGLGLWLEIGQRFSVVVGLAPLLGGLGLLGYGIHLFNAHTSAATEDPARHEQERAKRRADLWDEIGDRVRVELSEELERAREAEGDAGR